MILLNRWTMKWPSQAQPVQCNSNAATESAVNYIYGLRKPYPLFSGLANISGSEEYSAPY